LVIYSYRGAGRHIPLHPAKEESPVTNRDHAQGTPGQAGPPSTAGQEAAPPPHASALTRQAVTPGPGASGAITIGEHIGRDGDWLHCICGNTPGASGFQTCLPDGTEVEPDVDGPWDEHSYLCLTCGRIVNYDTLEVTGFQPEWETLGRTGKSHEPAPGTLCWCGRVHVPDAPGPLTLPEGGYPSDGEPAGAYINDDGPGRGYQVTLYDAYVGTFPEYPDALDHLRIAIVDQSVDPERLSLFFVAHATNLWVLLPPLDEIEPRWDRPQTDAQRAWLAALGERVGVEAMCALCGQTFNPSDSDDGITHGVRIDPPDDHVQGVERECGGPGVLLGAWG
jgi:hypothetical protein